MNCITNKLIVNKIVWLGIFAFLFRFAVNGQVEQVIITTEYDQLSWKEFAKQLETDYNIRIFYHPDSIPKKIISVSQDSILMIPFLENLFSPENVKVSFDGSGNIFLSKNNRISTRLDPDFYKPLQTDTRPKDFKTDSIPPSERKYLDTKSEYLAETIVVGTPKGKVLGFTPKVTGRVRSSEDSSALVQATLYIPETGLVATTDDKGYFGFNLNKGSYTLEVNSIESRERKFKLLVYSDGNADIWLDPKLYQLEEFVVSGDRDFNVRGTQMGLEKISVKSIKEIPVVLGEKDIIKVALLLPGVQTVGEGATGFNVRGSPADQNLFYIDHVPVYNTSHLFGFFSAFNADAINEFSLLKSNIPAEFGGRLSSIFDINSKEGNYNKFSARGGISPITGRLMVEGPFVKNKSSYLLGFRSTYSNWILNLVEDPDIKNSEAYFGDAVANLSFKLSPQDQLKVFTYFSYDDAKIARLTQYKYQNQGGSILWDHDFGGQKSLELIFSSAKYSFNDQNTEFDYNSYKQSYVLDHNEIKAVFRLGIFDNHKINFGINSTLYSINRGDFLPLEPESQVQPRSFEPEQGLESGIFIGDQWTITEKLEVYGGLRFNMYNYLGPKTVFTYEPSKPRVPETISDTLTYNSGDIIKTHTGLDYRFAVKYLLASDFSVKASVNKLHQYIFLLSNTIAISPNDHWKLTDYNIEPMKGMQYSVGFYKNFLGNALEASVESYYKKVENLVEYKDGADLIANEFPETEIIQGDLDAYGLELMLKKPYGKLNGWVNYTYSRATVLVNNERTGEQNNFGISYPANWEKPHALNLVANYRVSRRVSFSGTVVYSTGRPITYPTAIFFQNGIQITHYSLRNEYRLPDYFRIDLSVNIEGNLLVKKLVHSSLSFSVYNLTGRKNAYSVYFKSEGGYIKGYRLSVFGTPIFSLTYNFKLGGYEN
jgi:hypothetical protein